MASNEKPFIPVCTHVVGSQLVEVGHSRLPPFLYQEDPFNMIFDDIGLILMKMES